MNEYTVSQLARAAGVGTETVRHYEQIGLLAPAARGDSGYRLFPTESVARMSFIRQAKSLGFTLPEIAELLKLSDQRQTDSATDMLRLREAATAKMADIEGRIAELQKVREGLRQLIASCPGQGRLAACPILSALSGTNACKQRRKPAHSDCGKT